MTSSDRFPVPVRSVVKSNLTDWCFQNLSKRALNALTVQASTTDVKVMIDLQYSSNLQNLLRRGRKAFISYDSLAKS